MANVDAGDEFRRLEFTRRAEALLGQGWRKRFAAGSGAAYASVKRWGHGAVPVPAWADSVLDLIETLNVAGVPLPEAWNP